MCGFVGFYEPVPGRDPRATCQLMLHELSHRGPDGSGSWHDERVALALGHTRLAIQDTTNAGAQPMLSHSKRFVIVFNGEVYNLEDLRSRLEQMGEGWRGRSDTEVFLEAIESLGIDEALRTTIGMFAFAVWDRGERILTLARDRFGEKPVYWGWQRGVLLFASELSAIRRHWAFEGHLSLNAVGA